MITTDQAQQILNGGNVIDSEGNKIGTVSQVFLDDQTGEPEWVTVKTGMFGGAESFVPLATATVSGNDVRVPFTKDKIKGAPRVSDSEGHLDESEEDELFAYYDLSTTSTSNTTSNTTSDSTQDTAQHPSFQNPDTSDRDADGDTGQHVGRGAGHDTSGPDTDSAMTRSEEQLHVGTERVSTGKARLRKFVVTENVTKTVPVTREEVRIEREPITDANRGDATSGGDLTSEEHEVELSEERVVVDKETVPVERVRMETDTVTGEEQVNEEVRKEEIATDTNTDTDKGNGTTPGNASRR